MKVDAVEEVISILILSEEKCLLAVAIYFPRLHQIQG